MGTDKFARGADIAPLHGLDDSAVFTNELLRVSSLDGADGKADQAVGLIKNIPDGGLHSAIAGGCGERIMKGSVVIDKILFGPDGSKTIEGRQCLIVGALDRSRDTCGLQCKAELEEIPDILHRNRIDLIALARLHSHQPILLQSQ
jgi:hypothetical protein